MKPPWAGLGDLIDRFDHVAVAVEDISSALPMLNLLGARFFAGANHLRNQFRWIQFLLPDSSKLELISPLAPGSFLSRFLDTRGEGVHHLTYKVSDVAAAARRVEEAGFRITGFHLHPEWSEVFVHPANPLGTVIQLAAWPSDAPWTATTLDDVLAGRAIDET
jgi:methylmalonyl-CoA/ethylmalonyl-CoA epimerase